MIGKLFGAWLGEKVAGKNERAKGAILGYGAAALARRSVPTLAALALGGWAFKRWRSKRRADATYPAEATARTLPPKPRASVHSRPSLRSRRRTPPPPMSPAASIRSSGEKATERTGTLFHKVVGAASLVKSVRSRLMLCDLLYRFHAQPRRADPEFLVFSLRSPHVRFQIEREASGTSQRLRSRCATALSTHRTIGG